VEEQGSSGSFELLDKVVSWRLCLWHGEEHPDDAASAPEVKVLLGILVAGALVLALAAALLTQPFTGTAAPWAGPHAEPARLEETVRTLAALGPRNDAGGMARTAALIEERVKALGYVPIIQHYKLTPEELNSTRRIGEPDLLGDFVNVLVDVGPLTPRLVVVGAHFDVRRAYPGADDNGSGVAALLELARMLRERPPPGRVQLAFYSNEERGHIGSTNAPKDSVSRMLSLEMLGCFGEPQHFPAPGMKVLYPDAKSSIVVVGRLNDIALTRAVKRALRGSGAAAISINGPQAIPGIANSDHDAYWRAGVQAVMVTDTAWYRNPRYHTARDTPDTLDYGKMALVADGIAAAVRDQAH
jgi:peptidase M28-like protein